ncbi:hypothetical protein [Nitratifractor sp.]
MVSRIEAALLLLLILLAGIAVTIDTQSFRGEKQAARGGKRVLIREGVLREINASALQNEYHSAEAYQIGKTWYFETFLLRNPEITRLQSRHARKNDTLIVLEGNVSMERPDRSIYRADKVHYDTKEKQLRSIGPFYARKGESYVRGVDFFYDTRRKVTKADRVFAHYLLEDRKSEKAGK